MKDIYKNPILYYILVPVVVALWPLLVWSVYLPRAQQMWQYEKKQYIRAEKTIDEILALDNGRLESADPNKTGTKFDYTYEVDRFAGMFRISSNDYTISSLPVMVSGGQKSQGAKVVLKQIGLARFARFLSAIQLRWANLQCMRVTLTPSKGVPDMWKIDLDFRYYY
jgi:hypothetical protein